MLAMAYGYFLRLEPVRLISSLDLFGTTAKEVCMGQQMDMDFETAGSVTVDQYIEMIRLKTAVLLGASLKLGGIVAGAGENDLDLIYRYGEEPASRAIARAIIAARPIRTTTALATVVSRAVGQRWAHSRHHPATRTFQALRIAVNGELENLEQGLADAVPLLKPGGIYIIDDLLPQSNWPEGHAPKVPALLAWLGAQRGYKSVRLAWTTGLMLVVRFA